MKILLTGVFCTFRSTEVDIYCILSREVVDSSLVYDLFIGILDEETLLRRGFFFKLGSLALDLDTGKAVTASWHYSMCWLLELGYMHVQYMYELLVSTLLTI